MKNKVLIKFCGQCNSRFRLGLVLSALKEIDEKREYIFYNSQNLAEAKVGGEKIQVLILCGCSATCAGIDAISKEVNILKFYPETDETPKKMAMRIIKNF